MPNQQPADVDTSTALVPTSTPSFLDNATIVDDTPLWVAWDAAQTAWLESKRLVSGRDNTVRAYRLAVQQFFQWVGVYPWKISSRHAQEWAIYLSTAALEGEPLAPATVSLKLAALSSFYDFVQHGYPFETPDGRQIFLWPVDRANPFDPGIVKRPKVSQYGRAKYPTTDELLAILSEINCNCLTGKRDFGLLYTIATTCRRASEVLNLKWGDIQELNDGNYSFRYIYKGGDERRAVLNRKAFQAICAYLHADGRPIDELVDDDYIFIPLYPDRHLRLPSHDGSSDPNRPLSNHQANSILKKYARRCGVDLDKAHIHALRHAGARLRVEQMKNSHNGVDYMELMQLLGHSSLAVTQIYSQQVLEDPEDPGGDAAAQALLPKGERRRRRRQPPATQERLL